MAAATHTAPARLARGTALKSLARLVALVWLVPAMLFNVDWTASGDASHNIAAVFMILASALFIEAAVRLRSYVLTPVLLVAAILLAYSNTKQAVRNLSMASEAVGEAREAAILAASQVSSQSSQLKSRRDAQVKVAGEDATATIAAELERIKIADALRWQQTNGCHPDKVTTSREFCSRVAQAKGRLAAAQERDRLDIELRDLRSVGPARLDAGPSVPAVADPYVANIAAIVGELGYKPTERMIKAEEAIVRAFTLELVAAFGPSCWLILMEAIFGVGAAATMIASKTLNPRVSRSPASQSSSHSLAETPKADPLDRWIADELEADPSGVLMASDLRSSWEAWRDAKGEGHDISDRALWIRVKRQYKHDKNGGRPRYHGVRKRKPGLRLVA